MASSTLTGSKGGLRFRGAKVAKVRQFGMNLAREAVEDTCVGRNDRTYVPDLFGATGSATILLDPNDTAAREMLNTVFTPDQTSTIEFEFDTNSGMVLSASGFLTNVSPSVAVGEAQAASVTFQISGPMSGGF